MSEQRRYAAPALRARSTALLIAVLSAACGGDETLVLGAGMPRPYRFDDPQVVDALSIEGRSDNPSLTADLLEIYFTAAAGPGTGPGTSPTDVWSATRAAAGDEFDPPVSVREVNSAGIETSPVVSADGLTLWFASDRVGGRGDLDIWISTRDARGQRWSAPTNVAQLNSAEKDIPRPPGQHERVMPLASDRETPGYYQILFSARDGVTAPFESPTERPELSFPDQSTVDGFLTDDGLTLFYVTGPDFGPADLYVATRRAIGDAFELSTPLTELNTERDERDPWLSRDGRTFFFASDRSGRYEIYVASVERGALAAVAP